MSKNELGEFLRAQRAQIGLSPQAVAEAIGYAIGQPDTVDVNEIVVRATAQG